MPFTIQPVDTVPDFGPQGATGAPKFSVVPVDTAPDFGDAPTAAGGSLATTRGFMHTLLQENPGALADALEGASYLFGDQDWAGGLRDAAGRIRSAAQAPEQYAPQSGGLGDLWDNPSIGKALTYLGESLGSGVASTLPSVVGGATGAIVGGRLAGKPGAAVGAFGGATLPAAGMNYPGMYRALVDEGVKPEVAAKWAGAAAVPITALDVAPVAGWAERIAGQGAKQEVQRAFAKRIIQEALKGGLAEGLTEGAQQVIQERVAADVTGTDFWTPARMRNVLDNAIGGALTGGAFGGASGIRKDQVAPSPTLQVEPLALPPPSIPMPDRSQPPPPPQGLLPSARTAGALPPPERTYGEGFTMREGRPGEGYEPPPTGLPAPPELLRLENGGTPLLPAPERTYGSGFSVVPVDTAPDFGEPRKQFRPPEPELIEDQRTPAQRFSIEPVDVAPDFGNIDVQFEDVVSSIHKQESGGRETAKTSVTGARGGMQIQPATFAQYARPGESIDRPSDNIAVGRRIIADLWDKSGGDPARVAVGYFSGPGNIAPPGAATPWKRDAADPTGKTTSSYVEDVLKRLGRGGLPWIGEDEPKRKDIEFEKLPDQTPPPSLAQIEAALLGQPQDQSEDVAAPLRDVSAPRQEESAAEITPVSEPILAAPTQKPAQNIPENIPSGVAGASATKPENQSVLSTSQLPAGTQVRVKLKDGTYAGDGAVGTVTGYVPGKRPRVQLEGFTGLKAPFADLVTLKPVENARAQSQARGAAAVETPARTGAGGRKSLQKTVLDAAKRDAENYGVETKIVPIKDVFNAVGDLRAFVIDDDGKIHDIGTHDIFDNDAWKGTKDGYFNGGNVGTSAIEGSGLARLTSHDKEIGLHFLSGDDLTPAQKRTIEAIKLQARRDAFNLTEESATSVPDDDGLVAALLQERAAWKPSAPSTEQPAPITTTSPESAPVVRAEKQFAKTARQRTTALERRQNVTTRGKDARPLNIVQFLAKAGGIIDQGGELRSRDLHKMSPGRPMLVRRDKSTGMALSKAAELAQQFGYIRNYNEDELLAAIDRTLIGKPVYSDADASAVLDMETAATNERNADEYQNQFDSDEERAAFEQQLAEIRSLERDLAEAYREAERRVIEDVDRTHALEPDEIYAAGEPLTKEDFDALDDAITESDRREAERGGVGSERETISRNETGGAEGGGRGDKAVGGAVERGEGGGQQYVVPGVAAVTDRDRLAVVQGVEPDRYASDKYRGNPYPAGVERDSINAAYDKLFETMAVREGDGGRQVLYSRFGPWRSPRDRDRIAKRVVEIVRQIAPQTNVEIANDLSVRVGGRDLPGGGQFDPVRNLVTVALNFGDPEITAGHEAVHALRNADLFTDQEWATLEKAAKDRWIDELGVRDIEGYDRLSESEQIEEAIAQKFAEWRMQPAKELPSIRRAFAKIRDFFQRLANALRGMGFRTVEDVFEAAERGEVGRRESKASRGGEPKAAAAWHGSPHDFEKFSREKIGTGEGAQAYGYGLYFAGRKAVAEYYRDNLTRHQKPIWLEIDGQKAIDWYDNEMRRWRSQKTEDTPQDIARREAAHAVYRALPQLAAGTGLQGYLPDSADLMKAVLLRKAEEERRYGGAQGELNADAMEELAVREWKSEGDFNAGRLYQVELAPSEDEYLIWDKPLSEQSEKVKEAIRSLGFKMENYSFVDFLKHKGIDNGTPALFDEYTLQSRVPPKNGRELYQRLVGENNRSDVAASQALSEAGVRGIKYLDGASRAKGEGQYNYVIFDDADISIVARASLFNTLKRQAAPVLKQPAQKPGTNLQQSAVERIFGTGHTPFRERVREAIHDYSDRQFLKAKQAILDQFASVKALERETRGETATGSRSPYKSIRLTRNLHSVMAYVLRHGPIAVGKQKDGGVWFGRLKGWDKGGFEDIFKPIADKGLLDLWKGWAVAVRADRLMREGRENLMTRAEINALLPLGRQYPEFAAAHKKWQAFNTAMLDMAEASGLVNAEQRALWENADYIPFFRVMEDDVFGPGRGKSGVANQRSGIRKLKGGTAQLNDPIENMVMNMTSLVDRSFKNLAARKVVALALEAGVMERERYDWRKDQVTPEDAARELERIGVQVTGMTPQQHAQMLNFWRMQAPTDPNVISVMVGGKPQFFRVHDPMLLQSLTSMTPQQLTGVLGVFRAAKRLLTEAITIDPAFMAANGIRDTLASYVVTGQKGFTPFIDSMRGFAKALKEDDPTKLDIMANGGGLAGFYGTSPEDARKYIERHVGRLGVESIMDTPRKLWEGWHKIGQASESANRIAIADAVKKNGGSEAEQAYQAMDLLDFGMRGASASMRVLIETIPFLNARVQGLYRLGRGAKENPKAFLLRGSIIAAASLALLAENWDNPEYEKLEDWDKDTYWHLWIHGVHLRLPKPFEVGALFGTIPERMARAYFGKDDMQAAWKATKFMLQSTFQIDMPQLFAPLVEQWANRDTFTGRAIVGADLEKLPAWMQYRPDTSATAVEAGAALNKVLPKELESLSSPERIEHLVGGYFGTLGTYLLTLSDQAVRLAGDYPSNPTLRIDDIPVVKRFVRADPQRNTRFLTEFYDLKNEVDKTASAVRELGKRGEMDDAEKYVEERAGDLAAAKVLDKAAKAMTKLRLSEQSIMRDRQMTPAEKRKAIDEITADRNAMAEEFVGYAKTLRVMDGIANAP